MGFFCRSMVTNFTKGVIYYASEKVKKILIKDVIHLERAHMHF